MDELVSLPPGSSGAAKSYPVLPRGGRVRPRSMSFRPPDRSIRHFWGLRSFAIGGKFSKFRAVSNPIRRLSGPPRKGWTAQSLKTTKRKNQSMSSIKFLCLVLIVALTPSATRAGLITLSPSNVIGGSPVYFDVDYNVGAYQAGNIFNQQTGPVDMSTQRYNAWFPSEYGGSALTNRFATIDLGAPTVLSSIEIFNSNQLDRGTSQFSLTGGNSIQSGVSDFGHDVGSVLSSSVELLGPTSLTYSTTNPVIGQSFAISNLTAYRYLQLLLIDGQAQVIPFTGVGLAEVRLYAAVPEIDPNSLGSVLALVLGSLGLLERRRLKVKLAV